MFVQPVAFLFLFTQHRYTHNTHTVRHMSTTVDTDSCTDIAVADTKGDAVHTHMHTQRCTSADTPGVAQNQRHMCIYV